MSTIESVETYVLRVPLRRAIADSLYHREFWHIPVVEVRTADGLVGTGYSGVWAGEDLLLDTVERYPAPHVIGRDATRIATLWDEIYWSPLHWVGRAGVAHMALGMLDTALWDLAAQRADVPLWTLLGGRHDTLQTYNTDGGWLNFTVDELVDDMTAMVDAGWTWVKMKVGGPDPRVDLERVGAVRAALPPSVTLSVDVNQKWDAVTARRMLPPLDELGVAWVEEPLHPDDVATAVALSRERVRRARLVLDRVQAERPDLRTSAPGAPGLAVPVPEEEPCSVSR